MKKKEKKGGDGVIALKTDFPAICLETGRQQNQLLMWFCKADNKIEKCEECEIVSGWISLFYLNWDYVVSWLLGAKKTLVAYGLTWLLNFFKNRDFSRNKHKQATIDVNRLLFWYLN